MSRVHSCALLSLVALAAPAAAQEAPAGDPQEAPAGVGADLLIENAMVHTGSGQVLKGGAVLIRAGKIAAVGNDPGGVKFAAQASGKPMTRLDAKGRHLYPGLIDADCDLGLREVDSISATVDTREVGQINPNLRVELAINPDSTLLPVARTGGVLLSHAAARGALIAGRTAVFQTAGWTWEDMTLKAPAGLHVEWPRMRINRGGDNAKEQEQRREERLRRLNEAFETARAYLTAREAGGADRPDRDVQWEVFRPVFARQVPVMVSANGIGQLRAALDFAQRHELRLVIMGGADAWRLAKTLAESEVPVILGRSQRLPRRAWEPVDTQYREAARLHEAGVKFAFSTGSGGTGASNARNLRLNAAQSVAYGLPREVAIQAMTKHAAEILGVADRVGAIQGGKDATLFLADGDILETKTRVTKAWIRGRQVSVTDKQRQLYERYQRRPKKG